MNGGIFNKQTEPQQWCLILDWAIGCEGEILFDGVDRCWDATILFLAMLSALKVAINIASSIKTCTQILLINFAWNRGLCICATAEINQILQLANRSATKWANHTSLVYLSLIKTQQNLAGLNFLFGLVLFEKHLNRWVHDDMLVLCVRRRGMTNDLRPKSERLNECNELSWSKHRVELG